MEKNRSQYDESEQKEVMSMQTDNRLLKEMLSDENLNKAFLQVVKNKGAEGVDVWNIPNLKTTWKNIVKKSKNKSEQENISQNQ